VERREGGQRKLPMGDHEAGRRLAAGAGLATVAPEPEAARAEAASEGDGGTPPATPRESEEAPEEVAPPASPLSLPVTKGPRRPARYGLTIQFESRSDSPDLARLVESTVWVNDAHPAHLRAVASRSEGYHVALSVAMALAPLAAEPEREREFLAAFLERWGRALPRRGRSRR
jgi:hypothetical protein